MADTSNPTIDKIKMRLEQGYTLDELKAIAEEKGLMDEEVTAFFEAQMSPTPEKKNSVLDESDSDTPNMDLSVEDGSSASAASTATETSLGDTEEEAFQQKITDARASAVGGKLAELEKDMELDLEEWREIRSGEKPQPPMAMFGKQTLQEFLSKIEYNAFGEPTNSPVPQGMLRDMEEQQREYERKLRIWNSTEKDIRQSRMATDVEDVNWAQARLNLAQEGKESQYIRGADTRGFDDKNNLIILNEDGDYVLNENKTEKTFAAIDDAFVRREAIIEKEVEKLEDMNWLEETRYDFYTGVRNFGNGFVAAFDEDQGAVNEYYNSLRTTASFREAGLTEEDVAKGITGNLSEGNWYNAGTLLATQTVQQMPQILGQVAVAYATGGLGSTVSLTASSAVMGISAYGSTIASYKGLISDEKMYTMAVGDALVEFISERAFTGDVMDMLGKSTLKGASVDEVRRALFKKGVFSKEFGELVAATGAKMADSGGQEFMEELLAGVGGGLVHAAINGEEFSMMEALDGAILGFSSGATSGSVRASRRLLTGGMSALGFGGLRSEMLKITNAKQKLADELRKTTDANAREVIQQKIDGLTQLEVQIQAEQSEAYDQYSDADADATVKLNQSVKDKLLKLKKGNLTEEESNKLKEEIKNDYAEIQKIEGKYESVRAEIKQQKEANQSWLNSQETSVEVDENTKLPDTPLMRGIQMVAKALQSKGSKVFIHRNLDDAAQITGKSKMELAGANGFFIADDGSVHIMAAQAQQNTAYHEGFHRILREVDAGYAKRFVDAAFKGMDAETKAKYKKIYNAGFKQGGQALAVEETFAELAADITAGNINQEGAGTSVVRAAMGSLAKSLAALGIPVKAQPSFKEFANYVQAVSNDFKSGEAVTETRGRFGSNQVQEGSFNQLSEENLQDDNSQGVVMDAKALKKAKKAAKKATIKVEEGQTYEGSFINENTEFTNLAEVVENFEKENGRPPKILFWMGDQSARGTYTTLDGTTIELEGGISFSQDPANTDKGVVWATNKNNNEVQGLVKDADIVAIVSGSPQTGHRFYKGTWKTVGTELMEAFNRKKGETVVYPERGKNFEIAIPQEGFSDPLQAMRFFYETLSANGIDLTNPKEFMQKSAKYDTMESYLADSKGDRMGALNYFLTPTQTANTFFESLGMKSMESIQAEIRDGYLVENEFNVGDIYAFYEFERDADGKVVTQGGTHSTYSTDIKGKALGIANRKDNIYDIADLSASTTTEVKLSGKQKLDLLVEANELTQAQVDEINAIEDEAERNKAKNQIIRQTSAKLKEEGKTDLLNRLGGKSGYVSAENAGDQSLKRIVADAGTSFDGKTLVESLIVGQTMKGREAALQKAAQELVEEGKAKMREFKKGKENVEMLSLPVGMVLERAAQNEGVSFEAMQESVNPETRRKANIFFQSTIVSEVSDRILYGEKKADIIASLRAKGMSRADANLVYAKASQYAKGARKGWNEGRREMSKKYAEERRQQLKNESQKSKDLRKKAAAILKQEKKTGDVIIREIINLIKESGVNIKASQVQTLIRLTRKVSRLKGKNALNPEARYNVMNSVIDKVVAIIEKQETAEGLATYINTLRNVESEQKKLKNRLKKLKAGSKSPLISYAEQILDLTSINPSMLSRESLELLQQALKDLNNTTKTVSVRQGKLSNPYVEIEGYGLVDFRRAKIYFDNIFEQLKVEEVSQNERVTAQEASDRAFENGTDWVTEYDNILRERAEKELKGVQKKLNSIAKEMDLDLNDVNDLEAVLELLAEEKKEKINSDKETIINDAILPTFANFRRMFEAHPEFAAIFGGTALMEDTEALELVKARMGQLSGLELKRLEFAMYDFAVNGKALGISSLRAVVEVKNDANPALKALNLKSVENQGQITKGLFSRFENTPTFLRRIFKASEARIAQFMAITGFADLRSQVAVADMVANEFDNAVQRKAKELGFNTLAQQTRLQIYSLLSQKPDGMSEAQYLAQVFANLELAYESDRRFTEAQRKEIRAVLDEMYTDNKKKNYKELMEMYEGTENLTEMIDFVRAEFEFQQPSMKAYAEEFLGMNFKEESNYLPIRYRRVGSQNEQIAALQDDISNVNAAYRSHNMSKAQSQASSTFERNENAMGSKSRYIDLNFFNTMSKAYRENEVKHRTAPALAKVSAATSESNETFRGVVTQPEQRMALRKKIVQFLLNDGAFNQSEELFPKWMKNSISTLNDLTVLYYFGSVVTQTLKQMSAVFNTLTEGNFMDTFGYAFLASTGRLTGDMKRVLNQADIGGRDYIEQVVNLQSAKSTMQGKGLRERMMDLSTKALRSTDKVAATASWLVYFEQYMVNEKGAEKGDWGTWSENMDAEAAAYASTMVAKDQNISTARDKSDFNRIDKKSIGSVIQMVIMPFANFLLNKKMNLMLDVRNLGSKDTRMNAVKSISGTALEVTAFHAVSQFVIAPMITALASAFTGAGEEEEEASWYDWEFRKKMFFKGLATDMNPYILPIGAIESQYTTMLNMIDYIALEDDAMKHDFADRTWYENFQAWEKANGLPKFNNMVGRGDANWVTHLRSAGVYGDMVVELGTAVQNIVTLQGKNPYYISSFGSTKYVTPEDAKRLLQLETAKAGFMLQGAFTGLFSKEVVQTIKARERQISKRATGNENENIARILIDDKQAGEELIREKIDGMIKDNPLGIEGQVQSMVGEKVIKSVKADEQPSKKYVNTIRQINAATQDPRDAAMMAKRVMADLSPEEARAFERDLIKYYALKEGENAVVKIVMILNR